MTSYLEQALEQAEQKIDKGDFRKGLGKLDDACWNVTLGDSIEEFARIRGLAERVVEHTDGRLAKKAGALVGLTEERRTAYLEGHVPKGFVQKTAILPASTPTGLGIVAIVVIVVVIVVLIVVAIAVSNPLNGFNYFSGSRLRTRPVCSICGWSVSASVRWPLIEPSGMRYSPGSTISHAFVFR